MMMLGPTQRLSLDLAWKAATERYWEVEVHTDHEGKFGIRPNLVIDLEEKVLMEEKEDGTLEPADSATMGKLIEMRDYLKRYLQATLASRTGKVIPIYFRIWGEHVTDVSPDHKIIVLNLLDLLRFPLKGIIGVGGHEQLHALIDGSSERYDAHEPGRFYVNGLGDPRMHANAAMMTDMMGECIEVMLDHSGWKKEWSAGEVENFKKLLPHAQFCFGLIYAWRWKEIMPWIENGEVRKALEEALPTCRKAWPLPPRSLEQVDVDDALADFYAIADAAWPIYERLLPEATREIIRRLEAGEKPEEIMKPSWMPTVIVVRMPKPQESGDRSQKTEGEEKSEDRGGDQGFVIPATSEGLERESSEGEPVQGEGKEIGEGPATGSRLPGVTQGRDDNQGDPEQKEGEVRFSDLPPEQQQAIAKAILDAYSNTLADVLEPQDPAAFEARQQAIGKAKANAAAQANAPTTTVPPQVNVISPLDAEKRRRLEAASLTNLQRAIEADLFRHFLSPQAVRAVRALPRYLPPVIPEYSEEHHRGGHGRIDVQEVVRDRFRQPRTWKVIQRRDQPAEHDAALLLVSDVSSSQVQAGAVDNNLRASANLMYMAEHNRIRMDWAEIAFGSRVETVKRFGRPLRSSNRRNSHLLKKQGLFRDRTINGSTNIRLALETARDMLKKRRAETRYLVLVTDAQETEMVSDSKTIVQLRDEIEAMGIKLLVIATGDAKTWAPKLFREGQYFFAEKEGAEIPMQIVRLVENCHKERMIKVESDAAPIARPRSQRPMPGGKGRKLVHGSLALKVEMAEDRNPERGEGRGFGQTRGSAPTGTLLQQGIIASAKSRGLSSVARLVASLPPDKLTAVIRVSSSWQRVLRRKGYEEIADRLVQSDAKPTSLQRVLLVLSALTESKRDLSATASQITGQTDGSTSVFSPVIPTVFAPAGATHVSPTLQNLLVR